MTVLRILDIATMKLFYLKKSKEYPTRQYKLVILNAFSVAVTLSDTMSGAVAIYFELLPLRLFIGFNIEKRWIL
jgi:hypothetical protein